MKNNFLIILLASFFLNLNAQISNDELAAELEKFIQTEMQEKHISGLSACIVKDNQVVWQTAQGVANFKTGVEVNLQTMFTLASISKLFVATACAQLAENGIIDLDANINEYLPIEIINPNFPLIPITTRQLLQHKSSLKDSESDLQLWDEIGDPIFDLPTFCSNYFIEGGDLYVASNFGNTAPGTSNYWYSNAGFTLLGYIIEQASGMPFNEYCQENILKPLQMNTAGWFYSTIDQANLAMPYSYNNGNYQPFGYFSVPEYPAAMLKANVEELANFLISYTQHGLFEDEALFSAASFKMLVPETMTDGFGWWGKDTWYGDQTGNFWSHGGFMNGVRTQLNYYPNDSTGLIILTNSEGNYSNIQNKIETYIPLFQIDNNIVNVKEFKRFNAKVFPNPISNSQNLSIQFDEKIAREIQLIDNTGSILMSQNVNQKEVILENIKLPKGVYLIKIIEDNKFHSQKIIIH